MLTVTNRLLVKTPCAMQSFVFENGTLRPYAVLGAVLAVETHCDKSHASTTIIKKSLETQHWQSRVGKTRVVVKKDST